MHFQHLFPTKVYNQWSPTGGPQPKYSPLNCPIRPRTGWQNYHLFAGLEPQVSVQVFWPPVGYSWWRRLIRKKKDILVKKKICFFFWCDNFVFTLSAESDFFFFFTCETMVTQSQSQCVLRSTYVQWHCRNWRKQNYYYGVNSSLRKPQSDRITVLYKKIKNTGW